MTLQTKMKIRITMPEILNYNKSKNKDNTK